MVFDMQRVNSYLNISRSNTRNEKMTMKNVHSVESKLIIPEHTPFTVGSNTRIFKHTKTRANYYLVGEASYMSADIGYEDDEIFSIWFEKDLIGIAALKSAKESDFAQYPGVSLCFAGKLQCSVPIYQNTTLALYRSIQSGTNWYRPSSEFYDGRFIEQEKT